VSDYPGQQPDGQSGPDHQYQQYGQPGAYGQPSQYGQPGPYGAPAYGGAPTATSGTATTSLVLGILSLVCLGFLSGIPAMILGRRATREIDASGGRIGGSGVATAGFVTGLIGTLLSVVGVVLFIGIVALGTSIESEFQQTCTSIEDC